MILNENLPGEEIEKFIEKIKNIKIILFVEKYKNKEKLIKSGIYRIYENGEIDIEKIKTIIKENNYTRELEEEIKNLRKIIEEKNNKKNKILINKKEKKGKIISIIGTNPRSKLLFIYKKIKINKKFRKKIILISFDWINKRIEKELLEKNIEIAQINNIFFSSNNIEKIEKYIKNIKKQYDYILINHSTESFFELNKEVLKKAEKIYFIIEKNIKEMLLSKNLLKIYTDIWNINEDKIEILINQIKKNKITKKYKNKKIVKIPYKTQIEENIWI